MRYFVAENTFGPQGDVYVAEKYGECAGLWKNLLKVLMY